MEENGAILSVMYLVNPKAKTKKNFLRTDVFKKTSFRLRPKRKAVERYRKFLEEEYTEALKKQLGTSTRVYSKKSEGGDGTRYSIRGRGIASGKLQKGIKGVASVKTELDRAKGRVYIKYRLSSVYEEYGNYISDGRRRGWIPPDILVRWINDKLNRGTLLLRLPVNRGNRDKAIYSIAWMIAMKAKAHRKPPVIKDWQKIDKNERLRIMFEKATKSKGAYYRRLIRQGILS